MLAYRQAGSVWNSSGIPLECFDRGSLDGLTGLGSYARSHTGDKKDSRQDQRRTYRVM